MVGRSDGLVLTHHDCYLLVLLCHFHCLGCYSSAVAVAAAVVAGIIATVDDS